MPKKEVPVHHLQQYLPAGTAPAVIGYLQQYKVHLTITRERKTVLGDYRHPARGNGHRISVNGNLNTYAFLVTLLHELAHLVTFEQYGNRVAAHGREWKALFAGLLAQFIQHGVFPADLEKEILHSLKNPAASSCAEAGLQRALRNYDKKKEHHHLVEELAHGTLFRTREGRVFRKEERLRKRFKCTEVATGKIYLFSPVYEIEVLPGG